MARILVVDDEESIRGFVERALTLDGHAVKMAADGAEALDHLACENFDLMLSDIRMPLMDGIALALQAAHGDLMHQHYFRSYGDQQGQARATEGAVRMILAHASDRPVVWIASVDNHDLDLTISRGLSEIG